MALRTDGSVDKKKLEKELNEALQEDFRYEKTDAMKKRAIHNARSYDEFRHMVACATLKPVNRQEMESLGKTGKGWENKNKTHNNVTNQTKTSNNGVNLNLPARYVSLYLSLYLSTYLPISISMKWIYYTSIFYSISFYDIVLYSIILDTKSSNIKGTSLGCENIPCESGENKKKSENTLKPKPQSTTKDHKDRPFTDLNSLMASLENKR